MDSGVYTLTLESFNTLSIAQSALKTDTITITVTSVPPSFQSDPETVSVTAGIDTNWSLPVVIEGSYSLQAI